MMYGVFTFYHKFEANPRSIFRFKGASDLAFGAPVVFFLKDTKLCGTKQHPTTEIGLTECIPHNSEMRFFQRTRCHTKIQISKMEVHNTWVRGDPPPKQPEKVLRLLGDHPHSVSSW